MLAKLKDGTVLVALICLAGLLVTTSASATSVELARKCRTLANRAYPLRVGNNPASGRKHGTVQSVKDYFHECVKNGGKMRGHDLRGKKRDER